MLSRNWRKTEELSQPLWQPKLVKTTLSITLVLEKVRYPEAAEAMTNSDCLHVVCMVAARNGGLLRECRKGSVGNRLSLEQREL